MDCIMYIQVYNIDQLGSVFKCMCFFIELKSYKKYRMGCILVVQIKYDSYFEFIKISQVQKGIVFIKSQFVINFCFFCVECGKILVVFRVFEISYSGFVRSFREINGRNIMDRVFVFEGGLMLLDYYYWKRGECRMSL